MEQLVHVRGTKDEGTLATRSLSYQQALDVELLRALGDPLGSGAMAFRVLPGLFPPTLLTKPDLSLLPRKELRCLFLFLLSGTQLGARDVKVIWTCCLLLHN